MTSRKTAYFLGWAGSEVAAEVERLVRATCDVTYARHFSFGEKVDQDALAAGRPDFVFSFGPLILKRPLLDAAGIAAINFHTAPPRWPGRGSCSFALLEGDTEFGVTAHLMAEAVDAGPILHVVRFPIEPADTAASLHARTLAAIPRLARLTLESLAANEWRPRPSGERWARSALRQKDLVARMKIEDGEDEAAVARKIRAFAHPTKPGPYIERAGVRFWYLHQQP